MMQQAPSRRAAAATHGPGTGEVGTYLAIARGEMAVASDVVAEFTGHQPRSVADLYGDKA